MPTSKGIRPPTSFLTYKLREKSSIVELVLRLSEYSNHLNRVGVHKMNLIILNIVKRPFANYVVARAIVLLFRYVPRENIVES